MQIPRNLQNCINCSACTKKCEFLTKYELNLADFYNRPDLAYSCFLCDICTQVCPADIDGVEISLYLRKQKPKKFSYLNFTKQSPFKSPYIYANNSEKQSKEIMFFGCNFPGYFPKTTEYLIKLLAKYGIDFSIDCCGKPLYEANLKFNKTKNHLRELFDKKDVKKIITACPNCYYFFKNHHKFDDIKISSIYSKLEELGLMSIIEEKINLFFPCPDKFTKEIFDNFKKYIIFENTFKKVNCCGMGGLAKKYEPKIYQNGIEIIKEKNAENVYTYCATCAGNFQKNGIKNVKHLTSEFLGICETPSKNYLKNIMKFKFYKRSVF
ncbi:succinate dehydrogenase/fumarate reductase iron-sulfur subunit [Campylobacter sputorum subsp. bubulus]|uniref:Succinate dehydrogenase/fumarate reductase iron-sulfur subunit n=1 Tax=Campylobacter sputorum subsp. sputorum TaxID=32024 RepID=A0A381DHR4_9BACT|nr:(Fe-S)-binding protein [Campylobacter sputorum]ASM35264.1 Fe-S oxidoreductase [Campylobacter sputorum aubsp. sputorum RM3237]ASM36943.1 Fe-S oxidoreductase [Campylobacter sputorum bv. faecalis CCUG 20703]ASM38623.1 Fe-S oxidoreductase [Campylobacter sputorum bv. paraureolyticus LMG 11764]KAB0580880.1 (Fe-S)-binding protein [Campylobacter sputorum subsp. sputorum]MDY6120849.1 (Fe-S)-binding protein [Campylobacter sputorum]